MQTASNIKSLCTRVVGDKIQHQQLQSWCLKPFQVRGQAQHHYWELWKSQKGFCKCHWKSWHGFFNNGLARREWIQSGNLILGSKQEKSQVQARVKQDNSQVQAGGVVDGKQESNQVCLDRQWSVCNCILQQVTQAHPTHRVQVIVGLQQSS